MKIKRPPRTEGDVMVIVLTKGREAIVDVADAELGGFNWVACQAGKQWYAARTGPAPRSEHLHLHREVARRAGHAIEGLLVDHRDQNGLNNRRSNIRVATKSQNASNVASWSHNTSGKKGVTWDSRARAWAAQIKFNQRNVHLGHYATKGEAASAYQNAAAELQGEFAAVSS